MSQGVGALIALSGSVCAVFSLYLLALSAAAGSAEPRSAGTAQPRRRLAVLVPAHNEERLIARCIESLLHQTYPRALYRVIVIADNCSDSTALRGAAAGAEVFQRESAERGKGQALRWAVDRLLAAPGSTDAVVVVDADSIADPGLLETLANELDAGHEVVQADYRLLEESTSPRSAMIAAGFLLFHRVRLAGRARLGMAANLVGNGMLFSTRVLMAQPWSAFSGVEDLEYSMQLRLAGVKPRFAAGAAVWGPGATSGAGVQSQRIRWEGGRFHAMRMWLPRLFMQAIRRRDAGLLDAALDLATPPLALLVMVCIGGACISTVAILLRLAPTWSLIPWIVAVLALPTFVILGLWRAGSPRLVLRTLVGVPGFLVWKLRTYLRLGRGFDSGRWDRSDRALNDGGTEARVVIGGVPVDVIDMSGAVGRLRAGIKGPGLLHVSTVNLDFLVRAQRDGELRQILWRSTLNLADGAPVVWLGRLLGARMPARVAGADVVPALMREAAELGARVFLLGGENGVAEAAAERLLTLFPGIAIAGTYEPPRAAVEQMNNQEILDRIVASQADVLLVALGNPKQERWIDLHRDQLPVSVAIGVGCVFDLLAGRSRRAPRWMQDAGLEWLYRLAQEPRRLVGRYVTDAIWLGPIAARTLRGRLANEALTEPA